MSPTSRAGRPLVDTTDPRNVESDLSVHDEHVTPTELFFIRSHFPMPDLVPAEHCLVIDGRVGRPLSLTIADLRALADEARMVTIECAGNSRALLEPPVHGVPWLGGAVGTAEWHGVRLERLLTAAELGPDARYVTLVGADQGVVGSDGAQRTVRFERSLPIDKALGPEVLVAIGMNGDDLPPEHGGPVRAIVAGWYGMASVKWLTRIEVSDTPSPGHWETTEYAYHRAGPDGQRTRVPVTEMLPKALIASPAAGSAVPSGAGVAVRGFAWAGEAAVSGVEFCDDGGASWRPARLVDASGPHRWIRWEIDWRPRSSGDHILLVRCRDDRGRTQPLERDADRGTYMVNEVIGHPVVVD